LARNFINHQKNDEPSLPLKKSDKYVKIKKEWDKNKLVYLVLIPVLIHFAIFQGLPIIGSFLLSFMNWPIIGEPKFVGLANWKAVMHDELAWKSLLNTTLFTLYYVVPTMTLGLLLASLLQLDLRGGKFFKGIFFLPVVTSFVVIAGIWSWLFNGNEYGVVNYVLSWFGVESINFFSSKELALLTLAFLSVFKVAGSTMIYYLAGLKAIPRQLYESAAIDGATGWRSFWLITFPLLKPTHFYVAVFTTIGSFQVFDSAYLLTGGGPDYSTTTIVYYMYTVAFTSLRLGYASVLAYILFMMILVISLIQRKLFGKEVSY
jgi:multiple sugar transport system permease protein